MSDATFYAGAATVIYLVGLCVVFLIVCLAIGLLIRLVGIHNHSWQTTSFDFEQIGNTEKAVWTETSRCADCGETDERTSVSYL